MRFRRELKLNPGEELVLCIVDQELHLFSLAHSLKKARVLVQKHAKGKSLVQELKKLRKEELPYE